jgi:hypothetical protein
MPIALSGKDAVKRDGHHQWKTDGASAFLPGTCDSRGLAAKGGMIGNEGTVTVSSEHDIGPAQKTYSGFVGLFKWGTIASIAVAILVVLLIA